MRREARPDTLTIAVIAPTPIDVGDGLLNRNIGVVMEKKRSCGTSPTRLDTTTVFGRRKYAAVMG